MLARYRIVRGRRPPDDPLPQGERQDTRKHTRHVLRPNAEAVARFLSGKDSFEQFRSTYLALLRERFATDREHFDAIADLARKGDVYLGCNCPTSQQPDVRRCHTSLALVFFADHYPNLKVRLP